MLSLIDSIFIGQLIDPNCSFNHPESNYKFDFEKAYSLLKLIKDTEAKTGSSRVSAKTLEENGFCAKGQGNDADALFNRMYGQSRLGKTMVDLVAQENAQWQAQINVALSSMYFNAIFNSPKKIVNEMKNAYNNREYISGNKWRGYFSNGIEVNFYLEKNNKIISFFPIYKP